MATLNDHSPESLSSLSAMFDGEATDQDIELLLNQNSDELGGQLDAFHLIQHAFHKDSEMPYGLQSSFVSNMWSAIDAEEAEGDSNLIVFPQVAKGKESKSTWKVMFSSVAVAASVTFVVIFSGNALLTPDTQNINVTAETTSILENTAVASLADLNKSALPNDNIRLQHYLRQHAEQAAITVGQGMIPMARVVSYPVEE